MKPTKKNNTQNVNRKDSDGNKFVKKIDNYYASAPKSFVIEKIGDPQSSKTFYLQALNEKLENNVKNTEANTAEEIEEYGGACALISEGGVSDKSEECIGSNKSEKCAGCVEKDNQLKNLEAKYKALQKVYLNQCHHFSELNIKHNVLLSVKPNHSQPDDNATDACNDDIFSPIELKILQNMSLDKKKDSTFIHQCLEFVYKNDLPSLSTKTLFGTPQSVKFSVDGQQICVPKKDPLTPEKADRIKKLFIERISKCNIGSADFESRIKNSNINKLFASCIKNISNKNI